MHGNWYAFNYVLSSVCEGVKMAFNKGLASRVSSRVSVWSSAVQLSTSNELRGRASHQWIKLGTLLRHNAFIDIIIRSLKCALTISLD